MNTRDTLASIRRIPWLEQHEAIHQLADDPCDSAALVLLALLDDRDAAVREAALDAVCGRTATYGRIAARALCGDSSVLVRIKANDHLGHVGNRRDVRRLRTMLQDQDWAVRSSAAASLGSAGGSAAYPALRRAMVNDPHPIVRRDAALALAYGADPGAIPWLESALAAETAEQARLGMLQALYELGRRDRLPQLLALLQSEDCSVRHATVNTLGDAVRPDDAEEAAQAIGRMLEREPSPGLCLDAARVIGDLRGVDTPKEQEQVPID